MSNRKSALRDMSNRKCTFREVDNSNSIHKCMVRGFCVKPEKFKCTLFIDMGDYIDNSVEGIVIITNEMEEVTLL